ncbi:sulfurtransferase complex subunit TusD [Methylotetracoccus oryzae]|uniref:sulfurtransferase complex subunit TusD n=1 Tax=Methylotetracoccus oryzae TaxID=1919059 RepID=UPI001119542D|nr:sulfurtransferase complex subunit TusD [Methylotetracoccus oryzae]
MRYAIQVNGATGTSLAAVHALQFIRAALAKGHEISLVFFYYDGVCAGLVAAHSPAGPTAGEWAELAARRGLRLILCVSAAERRGLDPSGSGDVALAPGFVTGGLGQWVDACVRADRCVVFNA